MVPRPATLIAVLTLTLVSLTAWAPAATPAGAQPDRIGDVQAQIDAQLRAYPGGVQTGPAEVSYKNGRFVITFVPTGIRVAGAADCPSGWFCFYDAANFGYPRGKLSDCGWQDLAEWGWQNRTESVHYNMASGSVAFFNHAAGSTGHGGDVAVFGVGTISPFLPDTSPNRNTADHVERYC